MLLNLQKALLSAMFQRTGIHLYDDGGYTFIDFIDFDIKKQNFYKCFIDNFEFEEDKAPLDTRLYS